MTIPPAAPRSPRAGTNSLTHRILHPGHRRHAEVDHSSPDLDLPAGNASVSHPRRTPASHMGIGDRLFGWARFPDAVIQLALSSPAARRPRLSPSPAALNGSAVLQEDRTAKETASSPGAGMSGQSAKPPVARPAAKTPPRPDRSPSAPATVPRPPQISARRTRRPAPLAINTAALLITAGGVLGLIAGLRAALDPARPAPQAAAQLAELRVPVETVLSLARIADVAVAAVAFGIFLLLASLVRDGRSWARTGACVVVAAALFLGFRDSSSAHVAAALLAMLGTGFLFVPSSRRYLASRGGRTA
ncbi:hypothetical protein ITX31_08180 [Arthrobacter gandavensis]|uniref:hypothetical protein n=1 Tax=Arthrobacter gandavensis TaxID=169960 RepID=UPI00188F099A|nr:hypothetical protein [Arthrobacter gandavensis]MBF4994087.1 hypothetical protein [Arthrobacter gandavensis]